MHRLIGVFLAVIAVAGCSQGDRTLTASSTKSSSKSSIAPPFLPTSTSGRSVANFACPKHPRTTIDMEACSAQRVLALNARANVLIKVIWARLDNWSSSSAAEGRRNFVKAERAWQTYVGYECISRSRSWSTSASPHQYVGGSWAPVHAGICQEKLTRAHIRELRDTAAELAPH
jgi:uncharacterized protein YecT (DUF1311 family)